MGLLPDNYWDKPTTAPATSTPLDPEILMHPTSSLGPAAPETPEPQPQVAAQPVAPATPEQAALDLFGKGSSATPASSSASTPAVAPRAYTPGLLEYDIPNALGFGLPDAATFESMSTGQKALAYGAGAVNATKKLVTGVVSQIPVGIGSIAATGIEGARGIVAGATESIKQGKLVSPEQALSDETPTNLGNTKSDFHTTFDLGPFGTAPSWYKTYDDAIGSGAGPLAASLLTGGTAIGDMTIAGGISESLGNLARPKAAVGGLQVSDIEPIKTAITSDNGKVKFSPKSNSVNEYYDTTPAVAKQYGGNPGNIKVKLSPVGDGTMDASIVRLSSDSSLKSRFFGNKSAVPSDFVGLSEVPVFSQKGIPMAPEAVAATAPSNGMVPLTPEEAAARGIPVPPASPTVIPLSQEELAQTPNIIDSNTAVQKTGGYIGTSEYNISKSRNPGEVLPGESSFETTKAKSQYYRQTPFDGVDPKIINKISQGGGARLSPAEMQKLGQDLHDNGYTNDNTGMVIKGYGGNDIILGTTKVNGSLEYIVMGMDDGAVRLHATFHGNKDIIGRVDVADLSSLENNNSKLNLKGDVETPPPIGGESSPQINIPNKIAKGTENLPITQAQLDQLDTISKLNGFGDNVKLGVVNALTGKTALGDLTNAEFVKVATQLGKLSESIKYSPTLGMNNLIQDWLGRRDSYFNSVEERTGIPTGQMYNRMENAARVTKITTETNDGAIREAFGKYWTDPQAGDLVRSYRIGDQSAITENSKLSPEEKSDLISIAGKMDAIYKKMGVQYGIPEEKFLENYSSNIRDTGGAVTQYADPEQFPTGSNFFAKYKRTGGLNPILTDERAIAGIYNHAGAKATYMPDALAFAKDVYDQADPQYKPAIKAYADAMAGNADAVERTLNNIGSTLNQKFGWNIPIDATRKLVQLTMDTTYAATMGANPATYLRQLITNPTFVFAENGAAGLPEAIVSYFKDPKAAVEELQARGFRIKTADPYGSALAQEDTQFGKLSTQYRRLTSASLAPVNVLDSLGRYLMMKSSDFQFNNAIDLYNSGKLSWPQVEKALDFDGLSPVDQNEIRQNLVKGDRQAAMDHLARVKIDDTQGTYRPNTLGRMMNGALGKPAFQFSTFADNYINMVGKWVKYGQWDKLVRFIGTQSVVYRAMLNQFGLNYSSDMGTNPAIPTVSPLVKTGADIYSLVQAMKQNSQTDINTNKQALVREMQTLGFPGVEPARVAAFIKSYNAGPDESGMYPVQSANGKLNYRLSFPDLFWGMFGFPTQGKTNVENISTDEINANTNYTTTKNQILQLIGNDQTSQATALMQSSGVYPSAIEINSYMQAQNIPLTIRLWKQLPKQLQAEFAPRVFGSASSQ